MISTCFGSVWSSQKKVCCSNCFNPRCRLKSISATFMFRSLTLVLFFAVNKNRNTTHTFSWMSNLCVRVHVLVKLQVHTLFSSEKQMQMWKNSCWTGQFKIPMLDEPSASDLVGLVWYCYEYQGIWNHEKVNFQDEVLGLFWMDLLWMTIIFTTSQL